MAMLAMWGFDLSAPLMLLGSIFGVGYALLGIGLVLAYRSSGFINFAHGAVGLVSAAMMSVVVTGYGVPYWFGFVGAIIVSALLSAGLETVVVQKLSESPKVLAMVATLGTSQALLLLALSFSGGGLGGASFPQPPFFPDFDLSAYISPSATALLILAPLVVGGLYLFLQRSRYGLAIRGAASNPDSATLSGVDPRQMSMLSWALAGGISAFAAMLIIPNQSTVTPDTFGPDFIIRGLAVAAIARFSSLPVAFVAGVGLGVLEQYINTNSNAAGYFDVALFIVILIGVALHVRSGREEPEKWDRLVNDDRMPDAYMDVWLLRNLGWVVGALVTVIAALMPLWITNKSAFVITTILALAIIGISVSFLTGLAGQLSLGQVAFAAIGAVAAVRVGTEMGSVVLGLVAGGLAGAVASVLVGLPALRVRGLQLAIATLAFALATFSWLLRQEWALGVGRSSRPLKFLGSEITTSKGYYYVALVAFVSILALASVVSGSRFGSSLVALRDNEAAARVFRIAPRRTTLLAYGFSGCIAGLGGSVLAFANSFVTRALFTPSDSINVVSVAVIGGLSELTGPLLGAAYLVGIPGFFELELSALAGLNAIWLILILEQPRGLWGLLASTRANVIDQVARWHGVDPVRARREAEPTSDPAEVVLPTSEPGTTRTADGTDQLLVVSSVTKSFGSLTAVNDVSLSVARGETLGLIGSNGAGKTTLFEIIAGFVEPNAGSVSFDGSEISTRTPEARSAMGLVRSFQNASLFPTMTGRDIITLARQHADPTSTINQSVNDTLTMFGLSALADQPVRNLSTGTRRIVELAANVVLGPELLLLDEPSAGIAQAETEALGSVIENIRDSYGVTIVVIEHDMPMLSAICDRMIALELGSIIAEGTPAEIQSNEAVIRSYLGDDPAAIARSGLL
ncbi:MAG: branched-chain amino acid ABC transporter permease/ATP-binding protein [Acidimicrobiales bacterium]|nr:branched-chain amino acid ABC transporter permease/ATP-binding protein [Acidimicrobiales bacterium]